MNKIYEFYSNRNNGSFPNYNEKFKKFGVSPKNPIIFILDNELSSKDKPLKKLISQVELDKTKLASFKNDNFINITSNLYLTTHQLVKGLKECEIEDLFDKGTLNVKLNNKSFEKDSKKFNDKIHYGKTIFADYVSKNYKNIDFNEFRPLLDNLNKIITNYPPN
ncbi:hypothetical protein DT250_31250 [Bacillus sp. AR2-1]|uniref:hypothetical protein n=1 Tax=Bacillus sp. AR2-1 TaxID=2217816 RepID=UPI0013AD28BA|nr:hypothetical protein [Bacillus sp. AR2-1]KAA0753880.1 hypothetical protein DT250_31250 [Bacillus sp. AR2-1]